VGARKSASFLTFFRYDRDGPRTARAVADHRSGGATETAPGKADMAVATTFGRRAPWSRDDRIERLPALRAEQRRIPV